MFIILDRDGVINFDSDEYIKSPDEWHAIPGSLEAIAKLNRAGYRVLIATNQSGIARGYYDLDTLNKIHEKMLSELSKVGGQIEEIFYCPHHPDEKCHCRKPAPGMLEQIQKKYDLNFEDVFFVGDNVSDIQVAKKVNCKPLLVLTGKGADMLEKNPELKTVPVFADLSAAVEFVVSTSPSSTSGGRG